MRIALIHYAAPPVVGGVERVIEQQAKILAAKGHRVVVLCGNKEAKIRFPGVTLKTDPGLRALVKSDEGPPSASKPKLNLPSGLDLAIVHNMFTMPFNPDAAAALADSSQALAGKVRFINWVHDVDVSLSVFASLHLQANHVAVSKVRRAEFCKMAGLPLAQCGVIPNGLDAAEILGLSTALKEWVRKHRLLERELVLFHPTRVLARKNLEFSIEVVAALRRQKTDAVILVTGAPDPHRQESAAYAEKIRALLKRRGAEAFVIFVSEAFPVGNQELAELYLLADALLFPSKREGFGLPLLEGALHRLPVFCSDIPIHREVFGAFRPGFFDLKDTPKDVAALIADRMRHDAPSRRRKEVIRCFGWERIYREHLAPLLEESS